MNILDRLALLPLVLSFVLYPLAAKPILAIASARWRSILFAAFNVLCVLGLMVAQTVDGVPLSPSGMVLYFKVILMIFLIYLTFVLCNYAVLKRNAHGSEQQAWIAFLFPLLFLCLIKYLPVNADAFTAALTALGNKHRAEFFIGISYMAFRLSHLLRDVQNGAVEQPTLSEYLSFAFFIPTMTLGPISTYRTMQRSLAQRDKIPGQAATAWLRILVGLTKYLFLATLCNQLTYGGLLLDGHKHGFLDLLIAIPAYTLYLYCNFSGFCDMVIGVSGLLGIEVNENFNNPFSQRNMQQFWNCWHMTLSLWFRDMMFTPMLKMLLRIFGPKSTNQMIAVTIFTVFLLLGVWHGVGLNFLLYGLTQSVGLVTVHYYGILLKRNLSKARYSAYMKSRGIRLAATALTFAYFSGTLFFFANSMEDMRRIANAIV